jgi:hypothetical protein
MNKNLLALLAFVAAALFFGLLLFSVALSGISLLAAGLFSLALGFVLHSAP